MLGKLERYAHYLQLSRPEKLALIKQAKPNQISLGPDPNEGKEFEEQDFIRHNVFDSQRKEDLYRLKTYRHSAKSGEPKAIVALLHGIRSHTNRGANLAHHFADYDITTVGFDYRGFGKSEGPRALLNSWSDHMQDSLQFMKLVKQMYPEVPLFPCGLSLGGATAYHLALRNPELFKGVIMMAPGLTCSMQHSPRIGTLNNIVSLLETFLPYELKLFPGIVNSSLRNITARQAQQKDELYIKDRLKLRTASTVLEMMEMSPPTFKDFKSPFLVVHGGLDKVISPDIAFELMKQTSTAQKDKEILFYDQMWHSIWQEPEIGQINQRTVEWINSRLSIA